MARDLSVRRSTHFVLWRPRITDPPPVLVIGTLRHGNPPVFEGERRITLTPAVDAPEVWEVAASDCGLADGGLYHYWFEVANSSPYRQAGQPIRCTDPLASTVDWRLVAPALPAPFTDDDRDPAAVVKFEGGRLVPCDPGGETVSGDDPVALETLPANNRLVIYELPTRWTRLEQLEARVQVSVGTFRDVMALVDPDAPPSNFAGLRALEAGRAHLSELGVNALELLPPADSFVDREWGYATSNYFAPDYDLGFPRRHLSPTASTDMARLVALCHRHGMRFFTDVVMAFATQAPYQNVNFLDFHVQPGTGDPEEVTDGQRRDGFGGDLFKYNFWVEGYEPVSGETRSLVPARQLMQAHLVRWMRDFRVDGLRLDSIVNIGNWDFVAEFTSHARALWRQRWEGTGSGATEAQARFLVVGEELAMPLGLINQGRIDALWNEPFKRRVRAAILGERDPEEPSFEATVRKAIDCRLAGFSDGAQAVNYVTSHDVEGYRNERLYDLLHNNGVIETEQRIKLAFVCLLTAVGVPMIFAGEEFADEHDLPVRHPEKQVDPVNFGRAEEPWRRRVFDYVARLVRLRSESDALAVNETRFLHVDFTEGKRVLVWQRGFDGSDHQVVVVANFSAWGTDRPWEPDAEYVVPDWPATPPGRAWREVTQARDVPTEWAGREPLFPWEAKVYQLV